MRVSTTTTTTSNNNNNDNNVTTTTTTTTTTCNARCHVTQACAIPLGTITHTT